MTPESEMRPDEPRASEARVGNASIALVQGDITRVPADAIVNAANTALMGGGGVDGAIHSAGGPTLMAELRERYDGCPTGGAVVTNAGRLPARWVIHAVGPVWRGGRNREPELLASAYREALARAAELGARHVTFPAISAGVYGYPLEQAARVAVRTVASALRDQSHIERVTFVLYSRASHEAFAAALADLDT